MFRNKIFCYFTVEASFIMPMVTIGIWFILMLGFYLYNLCCITEICSVSALRGAALKKESKQEIEQIINEEINKMTEERLILMEEKEFKIVVMDKEIFVKIQGKMKFPVFSFLSDILQIWEMKAESRISRNNPVQIIRNIRKMEF